MQSAPKHGAFAPRRFAAPDARADGRRRLVRLDGDTVVIARAVAGVFMNVTVPIRAYRGVVAADHRRARGRLCLRNPPRSRRSRPLRRARRDRTTIGTSTRNGGCGRGFSACRRWSSASRAATNRTSRCSAKSQCAAPRRGGAARRITARRARFLTRRKVGRPELCVPVAEGARELFGGASRSAKGPVARPSAAQPGPFAAAVAGTLSPNRANRPWSADRLDVSCAQRAFRAEPLRAPCAPMSSPPWRRSASFPAVTPGPEQSDVDDLGRELRLPANASPSPRRRRSAFA